MNINFNDVQTFMFGNNEVEIFKIGNTVVWDKPVSEPSVVVSVSSGNPIANLYGFQNDNGNISKIYVNNVELPSSQWTNTARSLVYYESFPGWNYDNSSNNMSILFTPEESGKFYFATADENSSYSGNPTLSGNTWSFDGTGNSLSLGDSVSLIGWDASSELTIEVVNDSRFSGAVLKASVSGDYNFMECCLNVQGQCYVDAVQSSVYTVSSNSTVKFVFNSNKVNDWLFSDITGITSAVISNSITSIGDYTFRNCSNLSSVKLSNKLTTIGNNAFNSTGLTSISFPNTLTTIGYDAFYSTGLTSISLPDSITSIGGSAFYNCSGLTSVDITNLSITSLNSMFNSCSNLTTLKLPSTITTLKDDSLAGCTALKDIFIYSPTLPKNGIKGKYNSDAFGSMSNASSAAGGSVSGTKTVHFLTTCDLSRTNNNRNTDYNGWYRGKATKDSNITVFYDSSNTRTVKGLGWTYVNDLS